MNYFLVHYSDSRTQLCSLARHNVLRRIDDSTDARFVLDPVETNPTSETVGIFIEVHVFSQ